MKEKVVVCWSGGKDSARALYEIQRADRYEVVGLITTVTQGYDRVSMHGVRRTLVERQARALGLPLRLVWLSRTASNEEYEARINDVLTGYRDEGVASVVFGDIFLEDIRAYRQRHLARIGLEGLFPLWDRDTRELARSFIALDFKAVVVCLDTRVLDPSFAGRTINEEFLHQLPPSVDPCGERGEFHSFVFDGPIFAAPVRFTVGDVVRRESFCFCDLVPV